MRTLFYPSACLPLLAHTETVVYRERISKSMVYASEQY